MNKKVLVVDDSRIDLEFAKSYIESFGFDVLTSTNGYDALDILDNQKIDLVIIDLLMPKMNGLELIRRVKRVSKFSKIKIMTVSAMSSKSDVRMAVQNGAVDYLVKPIDSMILREKIENLIGESEWTEHLISGTEKEKAGRIIITQRLRLKSLSEVGCTFTSNEDLQAFTQGIMQVSFLKDIGIESCLVRFISSAEEGDTYKIKAKFVGLKNSDRKKIRSFLYRNHMTKGSA